VTISKKKKKVAFADRQSYRSPKDKKVNGLFKLGRKYYVRKLSIMLLQINGKNSIDQRYNLQPKH